MNTQSIPDYINNHQEVEVMEVREQSFTFSKLNQNDNPQSTPLKQINSMDKQEQIEPERAEKEEKDNGTYEGRMNRSIQGPRTGDLTPPRKQSTSLTPGPKIKTSKQDEKEKNHSEDSEEEGKDYKGLTMKLQTALKKISNSKELSKTNSQPETVWRRFEECAERKKKDLQLKKQENQKIKTKHCKDKPTINKYSERLAREIGYEPIYTRYQKLIEVKKKKEEDLQQAKRREKEIEEEMFMEELHKHMKKPDNLRSYDNYYEEMVAWKEKTQKINREKLQQQKSKEMEEATFKPTLNSNSKKMVASHNRIPIEQRGLVKRKTTQQYSFTPNLNKKSTR